MKTTIFSWAVVAALLLAVPTIGNIQIFDRHLKSELMDIEKIVNDYSTKSNCCKGIKNYMRAECEIGKTILMRQYKDRILQNYDSTYFEYTDYYLLCFLGSLPDSIVKVGMNQKNVHPLFRAKYGDSTSLQQVLSQVKNCFFSNTNDEIIKDTNVKWPTLIAYLLLIRSKESLELFYQLLESTKYGHDWNDARQTYKISVAYTAIQVYLALYPPEKPFSRIDTEQFEIYKHPIESIGDINQADFKQYVADIEKYISRKEKHKVKIKTKYFHLGEYIVGKYYIYP
jgi:hypothetical protein